MSVCPLCQGQAALWHREHRPNLPRREYHRCPHCALVFVPPAWHLSPEAEKALYDLHENRPDDPGYRRFLSRAVNPLLDWLGDRDAVKGLDFGGGPASAVAAMLVERGHSCTVYDPFYKPERALLERQWDYIISTEVFEHLREPGREIARLRDCLRPGGVLVVMTKRVRDLEAFCHWHYSLDQSHVSFFSAATFEYIARHHGLDLRLVGPDVAMLTSSLSDLGARREPRGRARLSFS